MTFIAIGEGGKIIFRTYQDYNGTPDDHNLRTQLVLLIKTVKDKRVTDSLQHIVSRGIRSVNFEV